MDDMHSRLSKTDSNPNFSAVLQIFLDFVIIRKGILWYTFICCICVNNKAGTCFSWTFFILQAGDGEWERLQSKLKT